MRIFPPPLSVTLLPPSMTSFEAVLLKTFAVEVRTIVVGFAPQLKVITPPFATAATNASPVQLAAVPVPTTVVGVDTSAAWPSAGTGALAPGLPAGGPSCGFVGGVVPDEPDVPDVPPLDDVGPPDVDDPPLVPPPTGSGVVVSAPELQAATVASAAHTTKTAEDFEPMLNGIAPLASAATAWLEHDVLMTHTGRARRKE